MLHDWTPEPGMRVKLVYPPQCTCMQGAEAPGTIMIVTYVPDKYPDQDYQAVPEGCPGYIPYHLCSNCAVPYIESKFPNLSEGKPL